MIENNRTKALKALAGQMPVANQAVADGLQAGRLMGVQRAVAQAPVPGAGAPGTSIREVQAAGAQQAAAAGQIQNQAAAQTAQQVTQVGQLVAAESGRAQAEVTGAQKLDLATQTRLNEEALSGLGRDVKQKLMDERMEFRKDEAGRRVMNEYQLADWAVLKSKNHEELKGRLQKMELAHKRKMSLLQVAHQKIVDRLQFLQSEKNQNRDQSTMMELYKYKSALEEKMRREAADAANKQGMFTAAGTVAGAVVGAYFGGPAGAAVGAQAGGAAGSYVASQS
jgi:hypothetical protein